MAISFLWHKSIFISHSFSNAYQYADAEEWNSNQKKEEKKKELTCRLNFFMIAWRIELVNTFSLECYSSKAEPQLEKLMK